MNRDRTAAVSEDLTGQPRRVPVGSGLRHTFRALRHRNYRLFFYGQLVSLIGTWMQQVAQAWLVLVLVTVVTVRRRTRAYAGGFGAGGGSGHRAVGVHRASVAGDGATTAKAGLRATAGELTVDLTPSN